MRVFDCFPFFNELDILDIRLAEHEPFVDQFVLVESTVTFKGDPKPLHFAENKERFAPYLDKIRHLVVDDSPENVGAFQRERFQKLALKRGLSDAAPDDLVIISDADEILRPEAVEKAKSFDGISKLEMSMFIYYMNFHLHDKWDKAYALPARQLDHVTDVNAMRGAKKAPSPDLPWQVIPDAGWHFTYIGGAENVREKLHAYSHQGGAYAAMLAEGGIEERMTTGRAMGSLATARLARIGRNMPKYVRDNKADLFERGYLKDPWHRVAELEEVVASKLDDVAGDTMSLLTEQRQTTHRVKKEADALRIERDRLRAEKADLERSIKTHRAESERLRAEKASLEQRVTRYQQRPIIPKLFPV